MEGWPFHLRTEYVDSGSNVDPDHEAKQVFQHLLSTTNQPEDKCKEILESLKFTQTMMDGTIGELSGGWQMVSHFVFLYICTLVDLYFRFSFELYMFIFWFAVLFIVYCLLFSCSFINSFSQQNPFIPSHYAEITFGQGCAYRC